MNSKEELECMIDTDVLISVATSDLYHLLFLLPGSAIIAYHQPFTHEFYWTALSEVAQIAYYPIMNASIPIPSICENNQFSKQCQLELKQQPVYVHFAQLHNYLRAASIHIHFHKYPKAMKSAE